METVAGTGQKELDLFEGPANKVNIGQPFGVEIGPDGALYITEVENHRVLRLELKTGVVKTVAGSGRKGHSGDGGLATQAALDEPYEVRFDSAGNMYFVEMVGQIVRRVDAATRRIDTIAGTPGAKGFGGDGGTAAKAQLSNPHSIAIDAAKNHLYIADIGNHRIRRVDLGSGVIETIAGNGEAKPPQEGVVATGHAMLEPRALFIEGRNLWIALRNGHSVWRMDLDTRVLEHIAGTGAQGYTGDGGPAKAATMNGPKGIAVWRGHVYVVDTENQVIRDIDLKSRTIRTAAGSGPTGRSYGGDGGSATEAKMDRPHGTCVGPDGAIYIGDTNNHRVRRVR
jgi:DNA-binding beta-propeller fold protein YncE